MASDTFNGAPVRDIAVVLSGGGVNGVYMEFGCLKRLFASAELRSRIKHFIGTSSGALMAFVGALNVEHGNLNAVEEFMFALQPDDVFRPRPRPPGIRFFLDLPPYLLSILLRGFHEYVLEQCVQDRLGDPVDLCRKLQEGNCVLSVLMTDIDMREPVGFQDHRMFEIVASSDRVEPEVMAKAVFASAAISTFGLYLRVGDQIVTDGGWVRNFALGYAYERGDVKQIIGFRCAPKPPPQSSPFLLTLAQRLERFRMLPYVRGAIRDLRAAADRGAQGEPTNLIDLDYRLAHIVARRGDALEDLLANEKDQAIREFRSLREDILTLIRDMVPDPESRNALQEAVFERFLRARFPWKYDRLIPRAIVRATAPRIAVGGRDVEVNLEPGLFHHHRWSDRDKRALIDHGYALTDAVLREHGLA